MLLNAAVAEAVGELTAELRAELDARPKVDEAILRVVRKAFQETASVRFEGNNYSAEWVAEAKARGLLNLAHAPEALEHLVTDQARTLFTSLGILSIPELESRFHVKMERYAKDMLIEMHTLVQMVDTLVLPAAYGYLGQLASGAAQARAAGIAKIPQVSAANEVGALAESLQKERAALGAVLEKAEHLHEEPRTLANLLTNDGAAKMATVRALCDQIENVVADDEWPLPKYREMLFPV